MKTVSLWHMQTTRYAHPRLLIIAFLLASEMKHVLCTMSLDSKSDISRMWIVYATVQTGFSLTRKSIKMTCLFSSLGSSCERPRPRPDTYFKISGRQRRKLATCGKTYILFKHCISTFNLMRKTEKQRNLKGVTCIQNSGHNKSKDISIFRI